MFFHVFSCTPVDLAKKSEEMVNVLACIGHVPRSFEGSPFWSPCRLCRCTAQNVVFQSARLDRWNGSSPASDRSHSGGFVHIPVYLMFVPHEHVDGVLYEESIDVLGRACSSSIEWPPRLGNAKADVGRCNLRWSSRNIHKLGSYLMRNQPVHSLNFGSTK